MLNTTMISHAFSLYLDYSLWDNQGSLHMGSLNSVRGNKISVQVQLHEQQLFITHKQRERKEREQLHLYMHVNIDCRDMLEDT